MPSVQELDAPLSLGNFFRSADESDESEDGGSGEFDPCYEVQTVTLCGKTLSVRQYAYHSHNANQVWPGTYNLAAFLCKDENENDDKDDDRPTRWGRVLELGAATGILAARLASSPRLCDDVTTSDVDDGGEVEENVRHNLALNDVGVAAHVPHTWGTGFAASAAKRGLSRRSLRFDAIVASDVLLYVKAYPALVETLRELFDLANETDEGEDEGSRRRRPTELVMSWNRRMKESAEFFERMKTAGFECRHEGKCVYTFTRCS